MHKLHHYVQSDSKQLNRIFTKILFFWNLKEGQKIMWKEEVDKDLKSLYLNLNKKDALVCSE